MKNNKPVVSVVIPVYNGTDYLEEAVNSVFASTKLAIEVLLLDDGSNDGSKEMCRDLAKRYGKRIRFIDFPKNAGMTRSLNAGIKHARGEFIARINQDDVMVKGRLTKQVKFFQTHPEHVAIGSFVHMFTNDNPNFDTIEFPTTDEEIKKMWLTLSPFADPTVMYRREAVLKTDGYNQAMWPADDVHMWYQLGSIGKLANIPEYLTRIRWHTSAGSIRSHRLQMQKTLELHLWAGEKIRKPSLGEYTFWSAEYLAGKLFTPQFNWFVYRNLRKLWKHRSISQSLWEVWENIVSLWSKRTSNDEMVIAQPTIARRSGV